MADPLWVGYPRSYTKGRNRPVQFVVLHYTAGSEGPTSAENGARYDKVRTDGTSTHYFTDSEGPALQEVPDGDRAHAARQHGNEIGIQIEMCGTAQTRAQWLDATSTATMRTTAELVALLLRRHGLAFQRLTVAQARAAYYSPAGQRPTGIVEHATCTLAFPEDGGSHMDLGTGFPWDVFMQMVKDAASSGGGGDMDQQTEDDVVFTLLNGGDKTPVHVRLQRIEEKLAHPLVNVDLGELASAILANAGFADSIATAVADKLADRLAQ